MPLMGLLSLQILECFKKWFLLKRLCATGHGSPRPCSPARLWLYFAPTFALVAQLDRALDSGSKGRGFESSQARSAPVDDAVGRSFFISRRISCHTPQHTPNRFLQPVFATFTFFLVYAREFPSRTFVTRPGDFVLWGLGFGTLTAFALGFGSRLSAITLFLRLIHCSSRPFPKLSSPHHYIPHSPFLPFPNPSAKPRLNIHLVC